MDRTRKKGKEIKVQRGKLGDRTENHGVKPLSPQHKSRKVCSGLTTRLGSNMGMGLSFIVLGIVVKN